MKSVGLFIGQKRLLGIELSGSAKSFAVKDIFDYTLVGGIYDESLDEILGEIKQQVKNAQVTISFEPSEDDGMVSSVTQTPQLSDKELKSAMEFELTKLIGKTNLSKYVLGYKKIAVVKNGEADNFHMYVGGFVKDDVKHLEQLCRRTKLNLVSIETALSSTLFLYKHLMKRNETYIDLLITDKSTTFCLFQKGELLYHKKFAVSDYDLILSADSRLRLADDIDRVLSPIVRVNNLTISKSYISCTSEGIPQLDHTLASKLGMEFDYFPLTDILDGNSAKYDSDIAGKLNFSYVAPLAVAMRPFNKDLSLTLLSEGYTSHLDNFIARQVGLALLGVLALGVSGGYLYTSFITRTHDSLVKQQTELQEKQSVYTQMQNDFLSSKNELDALQSTKDQTPITVANNLQLGSFLNSLQDITPASIRVYKVSFSQAAPPTKPAITVGSPTEVVPSVQNVPTPSPTPPTAPTPNGGVPSGTQTPIEGNGLVIQGVGQSFEDIGVFSKKLQGYKNFNTVSVGQIQQIEYGGQKYLSFEIKVGIN